MTRPTPRKTAGAPIRGCSDRSPRRRRTTVRCSLPLFLIAALGTVLAGCASTRPTAGDRLLRERDYDQALRVLQAEAARRPGDPEVLRNLGIALLKTGQNRQAAEALEQARSIRPQDPQTAYYLARAREQSGDLDGAIRSYGDYLGFGGKGEPEVRAKLQELTLQKAKRDIDAALAREDSLRISEVPENSVAVPDFANVADSDTLAPLSRGLAAMVITDLNKVEALRVLERERIRVLLDELDLTGSQGSATPASPEPQGDAITRAWSQWDPITTVKGMQQRLQALVHPGTHTPYYNGAIDGEPGPAYTAAIRAFQAENGLPADGVAGPRTHGTLQEVLDRRAEELRRTELQPAAPKEPQGPVNPQTAPRLGQILGARRFVQGAFLPLADTGLQLDASIVETSLREPFPAGNPVSGPRNDVLVLEKKLVYEVLKALGVAPTPAERQEIDKIPTRNFLAFLAFSRGLMLEDRGMKDAAAAAYSEAVQRDPGFQVARTREEVTKISAGDYQNLEKAELIRSTTAGEGPKERLLRTGGWSGVGPGPDGDVAAEGDPSPTGPDVVGQNATIVVEGPLPGRDK